MAALHRKPQHRHGHSARPDFGHDARGHQHRFAAGTHILFRLHEGRTRFPALLRLPITLHHVHARTGSCNEHLPDVSFLGVGGRILLSADWLLLYEARSHCRFEESVYCYPFCRPGVPYRHPCLWILCRYIHLQPQ